MIHLLIHLLLLTLATAAPQAAPAATPSQASQTPAPPLGDGLIYIEVPDLPALLKAYERAPMVQMVSDETVRSSVAGILDSVGVDVTAAVAQALKGLGLPPPVAEAPLATARGLLDQVRSMSLSLSLADEAGALGDALSKTFEATLELEDLGKRVAAFTRDNQGFPPATLDEFDLPAEQLTDPWGRPYELTVDLETLAAEVRSLGADGASGGEGFDADVSSADGGEAVAERIVSHALGLVVAVDFMQPEVASLARAELARRSEPLGWTLGEEREVRLGDAPAQVRVLGDPAVADRNVWMLQQDTRLLVGYGSGSLERTLAVQGKLSLLADTVAERERGERLALGGYLEEPGGATVAWGISRLAPLERLLARVETDLEAQGDISIQRIPFGSDGLFRMRLDGERFVTELVTTRASEDPLLATDEPDFLRCLGQQPLPDSLWGFVPSDAIGVFATSLDSSALYEEILKAFGVQPGERPAVLAELEQRHGFSLDQDLIANLGGGFAGYLQPITGVISIPGVALVAQLRDAERFQFGLDGLLRLLEEQAGGEFSVRYKPYRDQPLWTFTFGGQGGGGMGFAGPLSVSPSLAIIEDHLIVTLTSLRAKKEIKRLLAGEGERHPLLTGDPAPAPDSTTVAFMDWPAFLDGTYEGARAALALFGGMSDEMPFDIEMLPTADTFTRFIRPTLMWSHRPDAFVRTTRIESSFGPETWLGLLAGGGALALGQSRTQAWAPNAAEEPIEEDPERAAAISDTELTLAEVATRLEVFRIENGRYPRELAELLAPTDNFPRGYLERDSLPRDGWERDLVYLPSSDGGSYSLWSVGEDGMDERGGGDDVSVP